MPDERACLFIDGASLSASSRQLGFSVDDRRRLAFLRSRANAVRAYDDAAVVETEEQSPLRPLTDRPACHGHTLVTKPAREFNDGGRRRIKGDMDVELAIDMMELAPPDGSRGAGLGRRRLPTASGRGAAARRARDRAVHAAVEPTGRWGTTSAGRPISSSTSPILAAEIGRRPVEPRARAADGASRDD